MRRLVSVLALLLAGLLTLTACAGGGKTRPDQPLWISITSEDWNGWDPDHVGTTERVEVSAVPGNEVMVTSLPPFTLRVETAGDGVVTFTTSEGLAERTASGGYAMDDGVTEFRLSTGEPVIEAASTTMDAGYSHIFQLHTEQPSAAPSLAITADYWVGWDVVDVVRSQTANIPALEGVEVEVLGLSPSTAVTITVTGVTDGVVEFTTSESMVLENDMTTTFTVSPDQPVTEFRTPSEDAEVQYTVEYVPAGS